MLPLRPPRPPLMQDEMAVLLSTPPPLISLPDAEPADPATVLNLRDQRNGLRGMEKARRIFLAAFVAIVEAWAAGMINTCGAGDAVGAMHVAATVLVVVIFVVVVAVVACVGSVFELCSVAVICVGVVALSVLSGSFIVFVVAAAAAVVVCVVVALALLWVAAASAAGVAAAAAAAAAVSSFCCTFVPILGSLIIRHIK